MSATDFYVVTIDFFAQSQAAPAQAPVTSSRLTVFDFSAHKDHNLLVRAEKGNAKLDRARPLGTQSYKYQVNIDVTSDTFKNVSNIVLLHATVTNPSSHEVQKFKISFDQSSNELGVNQYVDVVVDPDGTLSGGGRS